MDYRRIGRDLFVRLDKGEEIHESIRSLSEQGITAAAITSGIGRIRGTVIGYLDSKGVYQKVTLDEPMELVSMQGNLAPGPDGPSHTSTLLYRMMSTLFTGGIFSRLRSK